MPTSSRTPAVVLGLLYIAFLVSMAVLAVYLPDRVATHFDWQGQPNGWMTRGTHVAAMIAFGLFFPLMLPAIMALARWLPNGVINIPYRDYWLAPERRKATFDELFRQSLWFACAALAFVTGLNAVVWEANRHAPPRLSNTAMLALVGCFLAAVFGWLFATFRPFYRRP
jgi:uncharacterized membrane protein